MKNILVTGGAGFIGSAIVNELVKSNKVTVFDNLSTGNLDNLEGVFPDLEFIRGDIRDNSLLEKVVKGKETIYHMAAEVGVDRVLKNDTEVCETDYLAAVNLFDMAAKADVESLLFASSSEVYGKFPQDRLPMRELDKFTPDTVYGWAKYGAELRLKEVCELSGMKGASVRYFNVYGPRQTLNGYCVPNFIFFSLKDQDILIHGDGSQTRDLTYVDDAVEMTLLASEYSKGYETFNIGTGKEATMLNLASMIKDISKSKSNIKFIEPRRPTDLYHKMGDATRILEATGMKPETELDQGLVPCIEHYRTVYP